VRRDVVDGLLAGLGVEDVAVKHGHSLDACRAIVASLRKAHLIRLIVMKARKRA